MSENLKISFFYLRVRKSSLLCLEVRRKRERRNEKEPRFLSLSRRMMLSHRGGQSEKAKRGLSASERTSSASLYTTRERKRNTDSMDRGIHTSSSLLVPFLVDFPGRPQAVFRQTSLQTLSWGKLSISFVLRSSLLSFFLTQSPPFLINSRLSIRPISGRKVHTDDRTCRASLPSVRQLLAPPLPSEFKAFQWNYIVKRLDFFLLFFYTTSLS